MTRVKTSKTKHLGKMRKPLASHVAITTLLWRCQFDKGVLKCSILVKPLKPSGRNRGRVMHIKICCVIAEWAWCCCVEGYAANSKTDFGEKENHALALHFQLHFVGFRASSYFELNSLRSSWQLSRYSTVKQEFSYEGKPFHEIRYLASLHTMCLSSIASTSHSTELSLTIGCGSGGASLSQ